MHTLKPLLFSTKTRIQVHGKFSRPVLGHDEDALECIFTTARHSPVVLHSSGYRFACYLDALQKTLGCQHRRRPNQTRHLVRIEKQAFRKLAAILAAACVCTFLDACESRVSGSIYHSNGGAVQVQFQSGGKAYASAGTIIRACSYSESGKTVSLVCDGDTTSFTVQDDGALVGPAEGLMARLTPLRN